MEDACKELDFKCAVEGSGAGFTESDTLILQKLSSLKFELTTQRKYAKLLSEMLVYTLLTNTSENINTLAASMRDEITSTQQNINNMV